MVLIALESSFRSPTSRPKSQKYGKCDDVPSHDVIYPLQIMQMLKGDKQDLSVKSVRTWDGRSYDQMKGSQQLEWAGQLWGCQPIRERQVD